MMSAGPRRRDRGRHADDPREAHAVATGPVVDLWTTGRDAQPLLMTPPRPPQPPTPRRLDSERARTPGVVALVRATTLRSDGSAGTRLSGELSGVRRQRTTCDCTVRYHSSVGASCGPAAGASWRPPANPSARPPLRSHWMNSSVSLTSAAASQRHDDRVVGEPEHAEQRLGHEVQRRDDVEHGRGEHQDVAERGTAVLPAADRREHPRKRLHALDRPADPGRTAVRTDWAIIVAIPMRLVCRAMGVLPCPARGSPGHFARSLELHTHCAVVRTRTGRFPHTSQRPETGDDSVADRPTPGCYEGVTCPDAAVAEDPMAPARCGNSSLAWSAIRFSR